MSGPSWWVKNTACQWKKHQFNRWVAKIPWRKKWQPTSVFLPGKSHGQRNLAVAMGLQKSQPWLNDWPTVRYGYFKGTHIIDIGQTIYKYSQTSLLSKSCVLLYLVSTCPSQGVPIALQKNLCFLPPFPFHQFQRLL